MHVVAGMIVWTSAEASSGVQERPSEARQPTVFVTQEGSSLEIKGRLVRLGPDTVTLIVDSTRLELPLAKVLKIDAAGDSVKNGAILGAVVLGLLCAFTCGQGLDDSGDLPRAVAFNTGLGALIGAGFDAMHKGRTTLYPKSGPTTFQRPAAARILFRIRF